MSASPTRDARVAWGLLAVVLAVAIRPISATFLLLAGLPWTSGALALAGTRGARAVPALTTALHSTQGRRALIAFGFVVSLTALGFGPLAALLLATLLAAAGLLLAGRCEVETVAGTASGLATLLTAVWVCLLGIEAVLRIPSIAVSLGSPSARAGVDAGYDSLWTRNAFGFRSTREQVRKTPGVHRVLALGDSFTWGDKVMSADSVWPMQLERRLATIQGPTTYEVINMGQRGWTTANEVEQLRRVGWQFDPDLVLVQYFANDPFESGPNYWRDGDTWKRLLPARFRDFPAGRSTTVFLIEQAYNGFGRGFGGATGHFPLYNRAYRGWQQYEAAVSELGDSARARNVPVVMILYPEFIPGAWTPETYPLRDLYRQAAETAAAHGIVVLDLVPVFAAQGGDWRRWWALPWDSHPSVAGHALTAEAILSFLVERGLLPS